MSADRMYSRDEAHANVRGIATNAVNSEGRSSRFVDTLRTVVDDLDRIVDLAAEAIQWDYTLMEQEMGPRLAELEELIATVRMSRNP